MKTQDYLEKTVAPWSRDQVIKFLTDHDTDTLKSHALAELESTFADCETVEDMANAECGANFEYLANPLKEIEMSKPKHTPGPWVKSTSSGMIRDSENKAVAIALSGHADTEANASL